MTKRNTLIYKTLQQIEDDEGTVFYYRRNLYTRGYLFVLPIGVDGKDVLLSVRFTTFFTGNLINIFINKVYINISCSLNNTHINITYINTQYVTEKQFEGVVITN